MEIQITSRHEKASQSLQDTITAELEGLQKFYDRITSCHVILDKERGKEIVEAVITWPATRLQPRPRPRTSARP